MQLLYVCNKQKIFQYNGKQSNIVLFQTGKKCSAFFVAAKRSCIETNTWLALDGFKLEGVN